MIRRFETCDLSSVMELWLKGNIETHSFINAAYWYTNLEMVQASIASAEVYVYTEDENILGFIGLSSDHIEGLFVKQGHRSRGIGRELLDFVKIHHTQLTLTVYERNLLATKFYEREGFRKQGFQLDQFTSQVEYVMKWWTNGQSTATKNGRLK